MARKEFQAVWNAQGKPRFSLYQVLVGMIALGFLVLFAEFTFLAKDLTLKEYIQLDVQEGQDLYPNSIMQSSWAEEVNEQDLVHLGLLHEACLLYKDAIIPWTYGQHGVVASPTTLINQDDPDLIEKIRQCPDVDLFLPLGIRGHGYCEDAIAYTKFLQSRMLPAWALEMKYVDPNTGDSYTYHDLCPKTPMIFMNHYWDGIPNSPDWPITKQLYLMPNIEMHELEAKHYWGVDLVLCKTAICARRVRLWYQQEGNPRNTQVLYTRHTSSDVAALAKSRLGADLIQPKNFSDVQFVHAVGTSVQKGTDKVIDCWLGEPDFPPLHIYMNEDTYNGWYRKSFDERIRKSQIQLHLGRMEADNFGKLVAESSFFLCTSVQEGYGHYINQARATGAVIISTNLPPMNELLTPSSALLIPVKRLSTKEQLLGGDFQGEYGLRNIQGFTAFFRGQDVCNQVKKVLKMTPQERQMMGERARKQYFIDMKFFAAKMEDLRQYARSNDRLRTGAV